MRRTFFIVSLLVEDKAVYQATRINPSEILFSIAATRVLRGGGVDARRLTSVLALSLRLLLNLSTISDPLIWLALKKQPPLSFAAMPPDPEAIAQRRQNFRFAQGAAAVLIATFAAVSSLKAASAVVSGINPKTGKAEFSYWQGGPLNEKQARNRAIQNFISMGFSNPKIIDSTSRRGYGAIVAFQTADKRTKYTASLAAADQQQAIAGALRRAKAAGGRYAIVVATWFDFSSKTTGDVIKL